MWIGAKKGSSAKPLHLGWVTGVKNLGIYFSCQKEEVTVHNFEERLNQIQKTINLWSMRGLSLFGKVTIIKTFLIPKSEKKQQNKKQNKTKPCNCDYKMLIRFLISSLPKANNFTNSYYLKKLSYQICQKG